MHKMLVAAAFVAAIGLDPRPAPAGEIFPWCAEVAIGRNSVARDCSYRSIEACRPHVIAGNRGFCMQNPAWPGWYAPGERSRRHIRRNPQRR